VAFSLCPIPHLLGIGLLPDTLLMFFTAATALQTLRMLDDAEVSRPQAWLLLGAVLGLAGLSKYTAVFVALPVLLCLLWAHGWRRLLSPWPWLAVVLAAVLVLPVFVWNAQNDWLSFRYQLHHGGGSHWQLSQMGVFLLAQALLYPLLIWGGWCLLRADRLRSEKTLQSKGTKIAALTVLAFFVLPFAVLMLLGNSQQLASIFVRLQNMASGTGVPHKAPTTAADDLALFVRALFIAYLIACESTGTFRPLLYRSMPAFLLDFIPGMKDAVLSLRNSASLLFIAWCWTLDLLRAFLPQSLIFVTVLEVLDGVQIFGNVLSIEMLLADATLTNFACLVLMLCDAACVLCASLFRIYHKIKTWRWSSARQRQAHAGGRATTAAPEAMHDDKSSDLVFKQQDMNINSLNMQIFAKKSN
jgi:hypothetical protein